MTSSATNAGKGVTNRNFAKITDEEEDQIVETGTAEGLPPTHLVALVVPVDPPRPTQKESIRDPPHPQADQEKTRVTPVINN